MRTFKLTINENELKTLIRYNCGQMHLDCNVETSSRIHDLTKRLNKRTDDNNNDVETGTENQTKIEGWG